jgi:N-methylhydantoinase B
VRSEVLTFNSGGTGARPTLDGMNATAFPSGVMTMPVEATEQVGPVIIWRKELRPNSGGAGKHRGGLGQFMEVGAREGHEFDIQAMLDRVEHPARGRRGGQSGAPTTIARDDGTAMKGKGKQFVPHGRKVVMAFPGGAGYGDPAERDIKSIRRDLANGYITADFAREHYDMAPSDIEEVLDRAKQGEIL